MLHLSSAFAPDLSMPPPDPRDPHVTLPLEDPHPVTPASVRAAIDACNVERRKANRLGGLTLPMIPYPAYMQEGTR